MNSPATRHQSVVAIHAKRAALGLLVASLVVLLAWCIGYLRQPRYQGVTLNEWLNEFPHAWDESIFADPSGIPTQAVAAVRSIGPAAVPELMKRLGREDSAFKLHINELLQKQSLIEWRFAGCRNDHNIALLAFQVLGEKGAGAVPELTEMLTRTPAAERAVAALGCVGHPAVPLLLHALGHTNPEVRLEAIVALSHATPVTAETLEGAVRLTEDPVYRVRQFAVRYVGAATNHLPRTLPVLVSKLKDSDPRVRYTVITSFKYAGESARAFIPNLMERLCDNPSKSEMVVLNQELKRLGASAEIIVPCLIRALDSMDASVRGGAAHLLSTYERDAVSALPRLRHLIEQTTDGEERARLVEAAAKIESSEKLAGKYATNSPTHPLRGGLR